ncbi:hypothetical protein JG688_00017670 [Phytophthora aleatoria]|uniref:Uncharacterized protein n=1 Tax=Phytophthora aleatoria TaxID=2496075 RepID=A0A8J5LYD9_9STRA|nr:hypothetical protein JG688_00017670 [Phytophthora aleatoria]
MAALDEHHHESFVATTVEVLDANSASAISSAFPVGRGIATDMPVNKVSKSIMQAKAAGCTDLERGRFSMVPRMMPMVL